MIISQLTENSGSARDLIKGTNCEHLDLSDDDWKSTPGIISDVYFEKVRLFGVQVKPSFSDCWFVDSEFENVKSVGDFWGNCNYWDTCRFLGVRLEQPMASYNRFYRCAFTNLVIRSCSPMATSFVECKFDKVTFEGCSVPRNSKNSLTLKEMANKKWSYDELNDLNERAESLFFCNCDFNRVDFRRCILRYTRFENINESDSKITGSDASALTSDHVWWDPAQATRESLLNCYHKAVMDQIAKKLSNESAAFIRLKEYIENDDYSISWFDHLMNGRLSNSEFRTIDRVYQKLFSRFPKAVYP